MKRTARTEAIDTTSCPTCGADFGEPCRGVERRDGSRRRRKSLHAGRWKVVRINEWVTAAGLDEEDDDLEAIARLGGAP
jgi:hypothetical protein